MHFPLLVRPLFGFISRRLYKIKSDLLLTVTGQKQDCIFVSVNEHNFCKIQSNKIEAQDFYFKDNIQTDNEKIDDEFNLFIFETLPTLLCCVCLRII